MDESNVFFSYHKKISKIYCAICAQLLDGCILFNFLCLEPFIIPNPKWVYLYNNKKTAPMTKSQGEKLGYSWKRDENNLASIIHKGCECISYISGSTASAGRNKIRQH